MCRKHELYGENNNEFTKKKNLGIVREFSKVVRYKVNTQKHQWFSFVGTKILEYIKFKKFCSCEDTQE